MLLHKVYYIKISEKEGTRDEELSRGAFDSYGGTSLADPHYAQAMAESMGARGNHHGYYYRQEIE
jgi:hypothetical protein